GDYRESLGTLWYHDHRVDHTAENVYRGLFGFFNAFDELDTGNENDKSPAALRLPSGDYDIMLNFVDPQFDGSGLIFFDALANDGNLLEAPIHVDNVLMGVANRADVIVDFSGFNDKDQIYLVNRLPQSSGRGPEFDKLMDPGVPVLKFIVHGTSPAADPSNPL